MKYINALKVVPFFCFIIGIAINNMKDDISSKNRLIISLLLLVISLIAVLGIWSKSPKNEKMKKQTVFFFAFIAFSLLIFFYFLFFKK